MKVSRSLSKPGKGLVLSLGLLAQSSLHSTWYCPAEWDTHTRTHTHMHTQTLRPGARGRGHPSRSAELSDLKEGGQQRRGPDEDQSAVSCDVGDDGDAV